ncbi:MAG: hypothetical protein H0U57_07980 [Tatlockia sp.]|nr:hypothetical protein [Tatlockia sp.]
MSIIQKLLTIKNQLSMIHDYVDLKERSIDLALVENKLNNLDLNEVKGTSGFSRIYRSLKREHLYLSLDVHTDFVNSLINIHDKCKELGNEAKLNVVEKQLLISVQQLKDCYQKVVVNTVEFVYEFNIVSKAENLMNCITIQESGTPTQVEPEFSDDAIDQSLNRVGFFKPLPSSQSEVKEEEISVKSQVI